MLLFFSLQDLNIALLSANVHITFFAKLQEFTTKLLSAVVFCERFGYSAQGWAVFCSVWPKY